jgi:hypothetical protein
LDATFAQHSNPEGFHETIWKEPGKINRRKNEEYQKKWDKYRKIK